MIVSLLLYLALAAWIVGVLWPPRRRELIPVRIVTRSGRPFSTPVRSNPSRFWADNRVSDH